MGAILERIATEAIRQGWYVWVTEGGQYMFRNGNIIVTAVDPQNRYQFQQVIRDLVQVGLIWPPPHEGKESSGRHARE